MVKIPCETERLYIPECKGTSCDLHSKVITENGTYNAEDDNYDGYYQVTVNVPIQTLPNASGNSF